MSGHKTIIAGALVAGALLLALGGCSGDVKECGAGKSWSSPACEKENERNEKVLGEYTSPEEKRQEAREEFNEGWEHAEIEAEREKREEEAP